ncbi:hypothetical protein C8A05DRAFT_20063 [Staphylotrichum tortipilum]|uniref:Uncharacterized protein n=1 Tax=Staphylotrichum tortipilum TaxID=2831512 RepID=A0AAN6MAD5_9PEZI|nr:hypothetical protein C8A05DRAFT_20063 [Staphylotrichum longicolle]
MPLSTPTPHVSTITITPPTALEIGAEVSIGGGHHGNALQAASSGGHQEIVQMLPKKGADGNFGVPHITPTHLRFLPVSTAMPPRFRSRA